MYDTCLYISRRYFRCITLAHITPETVIDNRVYVLKIPFGVFLLDFRRLFLSLTQYAAWEMGFS